VVLLVDDEDLAEPTGALGSSADRRLGRRIDDDDTGARVVEVVRVVLRLEKRVRLGRDRADLLRAVPEPDEVDGVAQYEEHALLRADTPLAENVTAPVYEPRQLGVRDRSVRVDQRGPLSSSFFDGPVDEPARKVELARQVRMRDHATSRISSTSMSVSVLNVCSPSSAVASAGAPA